MKLSEKLIGKQITFNSHHDAFPSNCFKGEIIKVEDATYTTPKVKYTVKTETGITSFEACLVVVTALVETGEYDSDHMWSKTTTFIRVK